MLTYKASDIVRRAKQIADLENSNFISFNEQLSLLNEAYITIYQKAIEADTRSFVKKFKTTNKIIPLPDDFYQLKSVLLDVNGYLQPIARRPQDQNLHQLAYEMTGNAIEIFGTIYGEIRVEYIPKPQTLTFKPIDSGDDTTYLTNANGSAIAASSLEDSVLSFPNSTYFPYLSYLLAIAFVTKQGKDASGIYQLAQIAEDTFYSSMPPDEWQDVRITNMYNV